MDGYKSINRRAFIRASTVLGLGAIATSTLPSCFRNSVEKLTILHTNDIHSRIEPFPMNSKRYAGLGGFSRRATLINNIRQNEQNVLLLDAGDLLQGTPYFNQYHGELEFKLMSKLGYDAMTIGNHEFDGGMENLAKDIDLANFPVICSNYDFKNTPLEGKCIKHKVFRKGSLKIGIYGLGIELDGLVSKSLYGSTRYSDALKTALEEESYLHEVEKCDFIICLSHLGLEYADNKISDMRLAAGTHHTKLIIGGHTHSFLSHPREVLNQQSQTVYVAQVGWAGIALGRIDFVFDSKKSVSVDNANLISVS